MMSWRQQSAMRIGDLGGQGGLVRKLLMRVAGVTTWLTGVPKLHAKSPGLNLFLSLSTQRYSGLRV